MSQTDYPLSPGQRALWFMQQMVPGTVAYNLVYAARIPMELDILAFRRAMQGLVDRHAALRTTFPSRLGEPIQRVHAHQTVFLRAEDASAWSDADLNRRVAEEMYRPFDLAAGPLMRVFVFRRSAEDYVSVLAMHHIVSDLWSLAIFMHELGLLYTAEKTGKPAALEPRPLQYVDYVRRQAETLAGPEGERLWAFWQKELAGPLPVLDFPGDRPRPPVQTDRGAAETLRLNAALTQGLKSLAREHKATLFMTLLAAFQTLLYRYTGQEDILVISPSAGRNREVARLIGYFVNPAVLRADLSGDPPFAAFLDRGRQRVLDAFSHAAYPFPFLVERLQPTRDPGRPPLASIGFGWQQTTRLVRGQTMTAFALSEAGKGRLESGALVLESMALPSRVVPLDLLLLMADAGDELAATVEYNVDLFDAATMTRLLENFRTLLEGIVADPQQRVSTLPLLADRQRQEWLVEWNATRGDDPHDRCCHELFEAQVRQRRDATALTFEDHSISYGALNRRANQLARYLRRRGVGPETLVAIQAERSPEMIVGLLGILKAGAAYVPLDPAYPSQRRAAMLADSQAPVLLTQAHLAGDPPASGLDVIRLDADWPAIAGESVEDPAPAAAPENLAYVIYTSGSTGRPKGTCLQHRGLCNFVTEYAGRMGLGPGRRMLQFFSFSFDGSVPEIFMPLANGGTLCLARRETLLSASSLQELVGEQALTTAILPPAILSALGAVELPSLEALMSAAEACVPETVARWAPGRRFFNGYGPTEATVGQTLYEVRDPAGEGTNISIGRPIGNMRVYLLDAHLQPVPVGAPGEVHIAGVGLARGYLGQPGLTAERFIPDPFSEEPGGRLYRVGDVARHRNDGNLEFLGRVDQQVKIRGFRIELGEIEATLKTHPTVRDAVLVAAGANGSTSDRRLVAYVVPEPGAADAPSSQELRAHVSRSLPDYMVPSAFVVMQALPLSASGKVDRRALPAPERASPEPAAAYAPARTELEKTVASVWQGVLGAERIGVDDNFFELGGHSLKLAMIHGRLEEALHRNLSMVEMFRYPTVRALAEHLSRDPEPSSLLPSVHQRAQKQRAAMGLQQRRAKNKV